MDLSVIVPVHNGEETLGRCLAALTGAADRHTEIIVVDDGSTDGSPAVAQRYACTLLRHRHCRGAAAARNTGGRHARSAVLFFLDADCIVGPTTLARVRRAMAGGAAVVGGTYRPRAEDHRFWSHFQAGFIHYAEGKHQPPDYLAGHALAIRRDLFLAHGGFREDLTTLALIEDVEFSHRLRRCGVTLHFDPTIQVGHVFNYSLAGSFRNAWRKAAHWSRYSLAAGDLLADSGTAGRELKLTSAALPLWPACALLAATTAWPPALAVALLSALLLAWCNRGLWRTWQRSHGRGFALRALAAFLFCYPWPVAAGGLTGLAWHLRDRLRNRGPLPAPLPGRSLP